MKLHDPSLVYRFLICVDSFFFIGILVFMGAYVLRSYQKNKSTVQEDLIWSTLPAILLLMIAIFGWLDFSNHHSGETFYAVKFLSP